MDSILEPPGYSLTDRGPEILLRSVIAKEKRIEAVK